MKFILNQKIKYYTNICLKVCTMFSIASFIVLAIILLKYKPVYEVSVSGEVIGYVTSKKQIENVINNEVIESAANIAFVVYKQEPTYNFKFISDVKTNEMEIIDVLTQNAEVMYKVYAVTLNGESISYLNTLKEAEDVVYELKNKNNDNVNIDLGIREIYTEKLEDITQLVIATNNSDNSTETAKQQVNDVIVDMEKSTINGVYFSATPTIGNISSRFGSRESIRKSAHKGLDIAASRGTSIVAAATGKVTFAGWSGGYGYLVVLDHGNGVESYYGHASKIYVSEGQEVAVGTQIAAVGSTGRSTGNHLHFEIRVDGEAVNPQKYLYENQ